MNIASILQHAASDTKAFPKEMGDVTNTLTVHTHTYLIRAVDDCICSGYDCCSKCSTIIYRGLIRIKHFLVRMEEKEWCRVYIPYSKPPDLLVNKPC